MRTRTKAQENLLARYNCRPVNLVGDSNALYERHVTFDHVVPDAEYARAIWAVEPSRVG